MKTRKPYMYIVGSMEGREYKDVLIEHTMLRENFTQLGYNVLDPLSKENHRKTGKTTLHKCGMRQLDVFKMDIGCVEKSELVYWATADIISEGSEVEFAVAGWINQNKFRFRYFAAWPIPYKRMVMIGEKRASGELNHFQNMWPDVEIYATHEEFFAQELRSRRYTPF